MNHSAIRRCTVGHYRKINKNNSWVIIVLLTSTGAGTKKKTHLSINYSTTKEIMGRNWLRAGRPRGRSSCPVQARFFYSPRPPDRLWGPQASCRKGIGSSFPGGRAAGARSWIVPRSRIHGSIDPLPHTSSWRSVWLLKDKYKLTFYFYCYFKLPQRFGADADPVLGVKEI
jgi:hypothetical protein